MAKTAEKVAKAASPADKKSAKNSIGSNAQASGSSTTSKKVAPPATLPASLIKSLPVSVDIMQHVRAIEKLLPTLEKQLKASEKAGVIATARAFVVMHRMKDAMHSEKDGSVTKAFLKIFERYDKEILPHMFEVEGVSNVPLAEGFRVQRSDKFYASVKKGMQEAAYKWLQDNDLGDLIKATVNSSSLSAGLKGLIEDKNVEAPEDIFTAAYVPATSVVKT